MRSVLYGKSFVAMVLAMFWVSVLVAQKPKLKSVDYRNFAKETSALSLHKRVYTQYDMDGSVIKQENYEKSPTTGEMVRRSLTANSSNARGRYQTVVSYDSLGMPIQEELRVSNAGGQKQKTIFAVYEKGVPRRYTTVYSYNKAGKVVQAKSYNLLNELIGVEDHKYAKTGEELSVKSWFYMDDQKLTKVSYSKKTTFDDQGNLKETFIVKNELSPQGNKEYREEIFFERNQTVKWLKYTNGVLTSQYSRGGETAGLKSSGQSDFGTWATNTDYDSLGNKIKTTYTEVDEETGEDIITQVNFFAYDESGNMTKTTKVFYEPEGERVEEETTEYDKFDNITRFATYENGELTSENIYNYEFHF